MNAFSCFNGRINGCYKFYDVEDKSNYHIGDIIGCNNFICKHDRNSPPKTIAINK
jgi:hypothetical protein